ncbi:MAG TPA: alpha/beta fold hydrolase [Noviherbaspirillum sp.]
MMDFRKLAHRWIQDRLRAPRLAHPAVPEDFQLQAEEIHLPTAGGKALFGWHVPAPGMQNSPAILVMHGWGGNAGMMLPLAPALHWAGFHVLLVDARCHGVSDEDDFTSLPRFAEDIEAGLRWLRQQPGVDGERLAVLGHSVGAGAALLCAARDPSLAAVISIGAFAHPAEMMKRFLAALHIPYPVLGWYVLRHVERAIGARFDDIAPLTSMRRLHCPVLLVHGTNDETVPYGDMLRLHAAAAHDDVECVAFTGGHDPSGALDTHLPELVRFLKRACGIHPAHHLTLLPAEPMPRRKTCS